jgi:chromosome segregation ATPase
MTLADLSTLLTQYRAAVEAQIGMLEQLRELARRGREHADAPRSAEAVHQVIDERDQLMTTLVALESELMPLRQTLARTRDQLSHLTEYREVVELHRRGLELVEEVVRNDEHCRNALRQAELARRSAADALDRSESTLAAYRRVVVPSVASPALVNRKG